VPIENNEYLYHCDIMLPGRGAGRENKFYDRRTHKGVSNRTGLLARGGEKQMAWQKDRGLETRTGVSVLGRSHYGKGMVGALAADSILEKRYKGATTRGGSWSVGKLHLDSLTSRNQQQK